MQSIDTPNLMIDIRSGSSEGHRCININAPQAESCKSPPSALHHLHGCTCARCLHLSVLGLPALADEGFDADERHEAFVLGHEIGQAGIVCPAALLDVFPTQPPAALLDGYRIGFHSASEARGVAV